MYGRVMLGSNKFITLIMGGVPVRGGAEQGLLKYVARGRGSHLPRAIARYGAKHLNILLIKVDIKIIELRF